MKDNISNKNEVKTSFSQDDAQEDGGKSYWNKWYLGVLLFLALQIIIFYLITVEFK